MANVSPLTARVSPAPVPSLWDAQRAAQLSPEQLLVYRSNLLGSDKRVTNFGGGNTSAKLSARDPLTGKAVQVLWVKGSGGDIASMKLDGFATLYMDKLLELPPTYQGMEDEDRMVGMYPHCAFNLNPRVPSIDTPLHAYIDMPHVDHMHPDALIAIAAAQDSRALTQQIYGQRIGWLPWIRPGFGLGMQLQKFSREHPEAEGVVLEAHGLFTWGRSSQECYENTIRTINQAANWLAAQGDSARGLGGVLVDALPQAARRGIAAEIMPRLRGLICAGSLKVGHFNDSEVVLQFVGSHALKGLAALGTSCPDHFLRTKIRPLVLDFDPAAEGAGHIVARLPAALEAYRVEYRAYYQRCKRPNSPKMRDPNAVVYLIPGVGMITFAADKATARIAGEFYVNAINVMREASAVSTYRGLPEQEAFDIEYWLLEEAKLQRQPKPQALAGRVALITGGAGGIGTACARRLAAEGACVVLTDVDREALDTAVRDLRAQYGTDSCVGVWADVTQEATVAELFADASWNYGGVDICCLLYTSDAADE